MFRRLYRDRAFVVAVVLFVALGGHLIARAIGPGGDQPASKADDRPECRATTASFVNDKQVLPEAPTSFLRSVDPALVPPDVPETKLYTVSLDQPPLVTGQEFDAALAGRGDQSSAARLDTIDRHIVALEKIEGLVPAYGASERSIPVVEHLSATAPATAFTLHGRLGVFRERAGADRAALDAYRVALSLDPADAVMDERIFVRWRTAALLQGQAKAAAIDALAEAAGLMQAQIALANCVTERRASLIWEMARLYEELGLRREAAALRDGMGLRHAAAEPS